MLAGTKRGDSCREKETWADKVNDRPGNRACYPRQQGAFICVLTFPRQHAHEVHVGLCYYAPFPRPWIFLDSLLTFTAGMIK